MSIWKENITEIFHGKCNMNHYYAKDKKFNYIRYNSLPALADHILDYSIDYYRGWGVTVAHSKPIGLGKVKEFDTIFVNADLLEQYADLLNSIEVPYHLLTGNADKVLNDDTVEKVLRSNVISWSAHNCKKYNEKFLQIPMGFSELGEKRLNTFTEYIDIPTDKMIQLIITPFGDTHRGRKELNNLYGPGILNLKDRIDYRHFLTLLCLSKYSCCPRGNALDSLRFVESIVCNSIPIVLTSDLDPLYREMGAIIIEDWDVCRDVNNLPITKLNRDMVTLEYWQDRIKKHQQKLKGEGNDTVQI